MQKVIEAVRNNKMGWLLTSKTFDIPKATLRRHVLGSNKTLEPHSKGPVFWKLTFPAYIKRQIVQNLKFL